MSVDPRTEVAITAAINGLCEDYGVTLRPDEILSMKYKIMHRIENGEAGDLAFVESTARIRNARTKTPRRYV